MQADFGVELGADDEVLELPWAWEAVRYYDLKRHPDLMALVEEAQRIPELRSFLVAMNSPAGILESAKCDVWASRDLSAEEEIFGAEWKFGSYVDLLFSSPAMRFSFAAHEDFAKRLSEVLKRVPEIPAQAELLVRRCFYADAGDGYGFYITFYLFGYGNDEPSARRQWAIALKLVENAIRQLSPRAPRPAEGY